MAKIEDLEGPIRTIDAEVIDENVGSGQAYYDDRAQLFSDLETGVDLIKKAKTIIDYLSDADLCKQISQRERAILVRVGGSLTEYLNDVGPAMAEMSE